MQPHRRQLTFSALLLALGLPLAGCPPPQPTPPPTAAPRPSCQEFWTESKIPPARQDYDFASDARPSDRGNVGYAEFAAREGRGACEKEWTVLVYMMADYPGMPRAALWNLYQMETAFAEPARAAASGKGADVVVQLDVFETPGIRRLHMYRSPAPFASLATLDELDGRLPSADKLQSPIAEWVDEDEEAKLTAGESLRRFLSWGTSHYPARHYMVIVWGHGFGWRPRDTAAAADLKDLHELHGGIAPDASQHKVIDIPSLHDAMAETSRSLLGGRPFDLYVSDACLMQSVEVVSELADVARYVGGAEAKLDPLGLPYRLLLPYLNGSGPPPPPSPRCPPQDAACQVAMLLPELTQTAFNPPNDLYVAAPATGTGPAPADLTRLGRENLTYSAVDAHLVAERLQPAMQRLGAALDAYLREEGHQMERQQDLMDLLQPHPPSPSRPRFAYAFPGGARDIGTVLTLLKAQVRVDAARQGPKAQPSAAAAKVLALVDEADAALRQAVLTATLGSRYSDASYAGMVGMSVWLPTSPQDFAGSIERFAPASFYKPAPSPWRAWLDALFAPPKN